MSATSIELALYRSGLIRSKINAFHFERACKAISRDAARIARHQLNACNGIQRWDPKAHGYFASWSEEDQAKADRETAESRETIKRTLAPFLVRGLVWDWKTDPRAGCVLRIRDKANRHDAFL